MTRRRRITRLFCVFIGVTAAFSPACREEPPARPEESATARLAVLSPALAIILTDLDLDGMIVGRHGFDFFLDESIPVVGNETGLDYEALIRADPTHVLLEASEREIPPRLGELAEQRGWEILTVPLDESLEDIREAVVLLDKELPPTPRHERVRILLDQMERSWREQPGLRERMGRTLALMGASPPGALGPPSFHGDLLTRLGAVPVPANGGMFIRMTTEDVIRLDPDSIVFFSPGANAADLERLLGPLSRVPLRAREAGRIMVISGEACLTPSTAMLDVADEIARKARAWAPIAE